MLQYIAYILRLGSMIMFRLVGFYGYGGAEHPPATGVTVVFIYVYVCARACVCGGDCV